MTDGSLTVNLRFLNGAVQRASFHESDQVLPFLAGDATGLSGRMERPASDVQLSMT
jgi:hypothetical protein